MKDRQDNEGGKILYSREAEMSVLGAMVLSPGNIDVVAEMLQEDDFFFAPNRAIYRALVDLHLGGTDIDLVVLKDELQKRKQLKSCGGHQYLLSLVDGIPNAANAATYAETVRDKSILRRLVSACSEIIRDARFSTEDVKTLLDKAQNAIFSIDAKRRFDGVKEIGKVLREVFDDIGDIRDRRERILGLPTGYYELDDLLSGLQKSNLYLVAGRPSMGKTSLAMNIIENLALKERKSVLFCSLEMAATTVVYQMLCSRAKVDSLALRSGKISEEDYQRLVMAAGAFHEASIIIDDNSNLSVMDILARARRMKSERDIAALFVDYLQLIQVPMSARRKADSREREVAYVSSQLKAIAKELEIPVVVISQLNRKPDSRRDYRPKLSDLRESGSLEQDADAVMLLFRPEAYDRETDEKGICYVEVAKNRTGPTGEVSLAFMRQFTRFENLFKKPGEDFGGK